MQHLRTVMATCIALALLVPGAVAHTTDPQTAVPPEYTEPPPTQGVDLGPVREFCPRNDTWAAWRPAQTVLNVSMQADPHCRPDNPRVVAAVTRGTNNVPEMALMQTGLHEDAVRKGKDLDGDGDPDIINITLEVAEINGKAPAGTEPTLTSEIAPGVRPGFWVFAPKTRGMASEGSAASALIRMPSPAIRVEQGDRVNLELENSHYMPHTIHFHGVDHPFNASGRGNDGVPQTSEQPTMPGQSRTYSFRPRQTGTMFYHCHVQPSTHVLMGLQGMFVVSEQAPDNRLQTLNIGNGKVRNPSDAVAAEYDQEYDLHYQGVDRELHELIQTSNDPRVIARAINRRYDVTERTPDYFLLNGRSFPYTIRSSQVITGPGERVKMRVLNGGSESIAIHTHGHKPKITHRDGVKTAHPIQRDVFSIAAAQRLDLALNTTMDGLNAYSKGIWFMHDHREEGVTTDGIAPGGDISTITYRSYLQPNGMPETMGVSWRPYFAPKYYEGEVPVWNTYDPSGILGAIAPAEPEMLGQPMGAVLVAVAAVIGVLGGVLIGRGVMG